MARKLLTVLLSAALCLGVTGIALAGPGDFTELADYEELTGKKLTFSEAPELRTMVAAGELPPVEERLPEDVLVVTPVDEVGQYGGTLHTAMSSPSAWYPTTQIGYESLLTLNRPTDKLIPNIAKGWEFSEDYKTLTLYLRKGMKWSDGASFTADDIMFWWEDVILNEEITPVVPAEWKAGGELMTVKKIDDYTVEYRFSVPNPNFTIYLSSVGQVGSQETCFKPSHALKEYHIKYNPEAEALAKEEDYEFWWQLFGYKATYSSNMRRAGIPVLDAWVMEEQVPTGANFKRNPYYWKVDTAGNQLPYIDKLKGTIITDAEVRVMRVISGETNLEPILFEGALDKYPLLMKNREKGGYQVWLAMCAGYTSYITYYLNQSYEEDPVMGKILQNAKFRQALSLGIDREEMNDLLALGRGIACQAATGKADSFYEEEWARSYAEYNPEEANRLLDEIGLDKRDKDGYRLRSDGETLELTIHLSEALPIWLPATELVESYWEDLGVQVHVKPVLSEYLFEAIGAGKTQVSVWVLSNTTGFISTRSAGYLNSYSYFWANAYLTWWNTRDLEEPAGQEPPEEIKELFAMGDKLRYATEEERGQITKYLGNAQAENLYVIGTVGYVPFPSIASANMRNIDKVNIDVDHGVGGSRTILAEQLYFKN